ncbi:MAG: thioesterase family protein [Candidatus Rokuibacteriota bacterium]
MTTWIETYRGVVHRWEVDTVDHFTVAYYFQRFADASLALLEALGLGPAYVARTGLGCVLSEGYVRYLKELRAGDILHVQSGVIDVDSTGIGIGHKLFDSGSGALCATVAERARHVELSTNAPVPLSSGEQAAARPHLVRWDGPPRERRAHPPGDEGFLMAAREFVKPGEMDVYGQSAPLFYIHRFSAANGHVLAAFGMTPAYQREQHRGFSTFEFQLDFPGRLRAGDPALVRSGLLHVGTSSLHILHRMRNGRTGEVVATLDQLGVHLDLDARRPAPLPEALRERARALQVSSSVAHRDRE